LGSLVSWHVDSRSIRFCLFLGLIHPKFRLVCKTSDRVWLISRVPL
jgi:hypothetical protein